MVLFIEVGCLRGKDNELVIKELAFVKVVSLLNAGKLSSNNVIRSFIFQYPYWHCNLSESVKRTNRWCTENLHNLRWSDGVVPYSYLHRILIDFIHKHSEGVVYTKGSEKVSVLQNILLSNQKTSFRRSGEEITIDIRDLDNYSCPKLDSEYFQELKRQRSNDNLLNTLCGFDHQGKDCALNKAVKYNYWFRNNEITCSC